MHTYALNVQKLRNVAAILLVAGFACMLGLPARAADAVWLAHHAIRNKILHEAGDRYAVRFLTTHVDRQSRAIRTVTGTGTFRRRGKTSQRFTYHTTVNIRNNSERNTGYTIR
jgi:hypothetical protein